MVEEAPPRRSESGFGIDPVYDAASLDGWDPAAQLGEPGDYPFTRGVYPTMYRGRPWTIRQYAGFGTARESNERYHRLVEAGTTGLSVAVHPPPPMGYDSDDTLPHWEGGQGGGPVDSLHHLRPLVDRIPPHPGSPAVTNH